MQNPNVIIVHGAYGYPDENWFGWLSQQLINSGIDCYVPSMPTPEMQNLKTWLKVFDQLARPRINRKSILIGHSLGAVFLFRWLCGYESMISSLFSIGAFLGKVGIAKFDEINKSFFQSPFNWQEITGRVQAIQPDSKSIFCYHGHNDPYVPRSMFNYIADNLQAKKIIVANAGHFNAASGYSRFPLLLYHLQRIMSES
jgi:predicted alpha/beta hydrolase family esterase